MRYFSVGTLLSLAFLPLAALSQSLQPLRPVPSADAYGLHPDTEVVRLVVKFHEGTHVRLRDATLTPLERDGAGHAKLTALGLTPAQVNADVSTAQRLLDSAPFGAGIGRLFKTGEEILTDLRKQAEVQSNRMLADLNLYYELLLEAETPYVRTADLVAKLNALPSIEIAYAEPPSRLAQATTSSFEHLQGYLNPAPEGVDAPYAWTVPGGRGDRVEIWDVEGAWNTSHEDLPILSCVGVGCNQINDQSWRDHGTAVMGVMVAVANGFGVTGIAHQAQAGYESVASQSAASAIVNAAANNPRRIVLIELHREAPATLALPNCTCNQGQCGYLPVEYWQAEFDAIHTVTSGPYEAVVVEAAGNGSVNLDDPQYENRFNRSHRDSGAILVAASHWNSHSPMCFTNGGSRIDVHGWGENVVTTGGNGDLFDPGNENRRYTQSFNGTSSASPIVAGAAASLQSAAIANGQGVQGPGTLRGLLACTGTPQDSDLGPSRQIIGPMPDLRAGLIRLLSGGANRPPVTVTDYYTIGPSPESLLLTCSDLVANDYDPDGDPITCLGPNSAPTNGHIDYDTNSFEYSPSSGFTGEDYFTYSITDGDCEVEGVVWITVAGCIPPASGDWIVRASCTLEETVVPPANVIVQDSATLTIASGAVLDIDFSRYHLLVRDGSRTIVKAGGKLD